MFFLFSASPGNSNNNNDGNNGDDGHNSNGIPWLNDYTPVHSVGTDDDNFWINYPDINPSSGQSVEHLSWVTDSLETE